MPDLSVDLWRNSSFVKLWAGQTISLFGSNITLLAIPLTAVTQLAATPVQMGILQMLAYLPFLLFGLIAGVWVDRVPRRFMLIFTDAGRAVALAVIPLAALGGWLHIEVLYGVAFVVGTLNLLFEAAYAAFLPALVPATQLAMGNSRLQASGSVAEIAGPALAGWLVQAVTAAYALLGDAISFVVSAVMLLLIRVDDAPQTAAARPSVWQELKEGLHMVLRNPFIRSLTICSGSSNLFINMHLAIYVLYLTRTLGFSAGQIGLLYALGSVGGLLGALSATRIARWLGLGRAIIAETVGVGVAATAIPLVSMLGAPALPVLALLHALWGFWQPVYIVNAASLRQVITPNHLLGRMTASARFISWGGAAVGFLIGGVMAEGIGLLPTLIIAGLGLLASSLWVILSPVRTLLTMPAAPRAAPDAVVG